MPARPRLCSSERGRHRGAYRRRAPFADAWNRQQRTVMGGGFERLERVDMQPVMNVASQPRPDAWQRLEQGLRRGFAAQAIKLRQPAAP